MTDFQKGVVSMCRNVLPAIELVRKGDWTLDDCKGWLNAVIDQNADAPVIKKAIEDIAKKNK